MTQEIVRISPESLEVANAYLTLGNVRAVSEMFSLNPAEVNDILSKPEVKRYIDNVYLDQGYRNRTTLGKLLDEIIESKLEEARETSMYTKKDLLEVIALAHKMRMDEIAAAEKQEKVSIAKQTNVQINNDPSLVGGNYGRLMQQILRGSADDA